MDVRCERCGTEYEFEDTRVTEEGVTVKCSTCGHLFKIRKKSFVLTEPVTLGKKGAEDSGDRNWMVRKADGTVLSFKELTTLQKWIVERKVSRDDEISKSGETWKRLGGIAELASFFQVVDAATTGTMPPAPTTQPLPAATPPTPPPATAPPAHTTQPLPAATPPSQPPAPAVTPQAVAEQREAAPYGVPQSPVPVPNGPEVAPEPVPLPQPVASEPDSWGDQEFTGDDDVVEKWKKRGRRKWFLIVPLLVIVAGVGVWYLASPESFVGAIHAIIGKSSAISDAARAQHQSGYAHFLKDSGSELELAIRDLNAAVSAAEGDYPEAMAILGEVYVTRAAKHDLKINALDKKIAGLDSQINALKPKDGSEPKGEVKSKITSLHNRKVGIQKERNILVDAARKDLDEAKRYIEAAREADPQAFAPKRARADYLRVLKAGPGQVEQPLKEARAARPDDPELLYVEGALLADDPVTLEAAAGKLARAVELKPELVRARYLLAEVLLKQKRPDDAREHLQRIIQESPDHQSARELLATLEKPAEPPKEEKPKEPGQPDTFEGWLKLAQTLQNKERAKKALEAFDAALELKPNDPTALAGKGFCFFDLGQLRKAIQAFRQALRQNPRQGGAIIGLAEVYKDMGDTGNALEFYQRYLEVLPNGPEAAVAERNVKELQ
jgi:predicted Zn finger-like uncharacterized protein